MCIRIPWRKCRSSRLRTTVSSWRIYEPKYLHVYTFFGKYCLQSLFFLCNNYNPFILLISNLSFLFSLQVITIVARFDISGPIVVCVNILNF